MSGKSLKQLNDKEVRAAIEQICGYLEMPVPMWAQSPRANRHTLEQTAINYRNFLFGRFHVTARFHWRLTWQGLGVLESSVLYPFGRKQLLEGQKNSKRGFWFGRPKIDYDWIWMLPEVGHNEYCLKAQRQVEDYDLLYPNHCRKCHGWGVIVHPGDFVPYGETSAQLPPVSDSCGECVEEAKCPRCLTDIATDDERYIFDCPVCGFHYSEEAEQQTCSGRLEIECYCGEPVREQAWEG